MSRPTSVYWAPWTTLVAAGLLEVATGKLPPLGPWTVLCGALVLGMALMGMTAHGDYDHHAEAIAHFIVGAGAGIAMPTSMGLFSVAQFGWESARMHVDLGKEAKPGPRERIVRVSEWNQALNLAGFMTGRATRSIG